MERYVDRFFDSIYRGSPDETRFEVVVADSSDDGTMERLQRHQKSHANVKVVHFDRRILAGTARNEAYKASSGDYVWSVDIDDSLYAQDTLSLILQKLDEDNGSKDIYYCPYVTSLDPDATPFAMKDCTVASMARAPVAAWTRLYRRELYVEYPDYMPENVAAHYRLVDKCLSVGQFEFPTYVYDKKNPQAMSRTYDRMLAMPHNLLTLAATKELEQHELQQEHVAGVVHTLADMFDLRDKLKQPEVRKAWLARLRTEYSNFMSGFYVH